MNIQGATGVLYNITGGTDLTLIETSEAAEVIRAAVDEAIAAMNGKEVQGRTLTVNEARAREERPRQSAGSRY
jgi:cell division GTPase FtsZ